MPTVINNPPSHEHIVERESSAGALVTLVVVIVLLAVFFIYILPAIRSANRGGTQINVPDKIEIQDNTGGGGGGEVQTQ